MIDWLTEPWSLTFMQHAFLAVLMVGLMCGAIGVFVILRGLAFMGDALSHAVFPGVVIAYIIGGSFLLGALVAAVVVALVIGAVSQSGRIRNDTAIGVFFVGAFALGIALMSTQSGYVRDLNTFLFGSILGVTQDDLALTAGVGAIVLLTMLLFRREFTMIAFDRTFARANGLNLWMFDQIFLVLLSLAIVASLQTVGNILVLALLVTPAATARMLTTDLRALTMLSSVIGAFSGLAGLYVSYYWSIPSGAAVVLTGTAVFLLVFLFAPESGAVTNRVQRRLHHPHPERDTQSSML